MSKHALCGGCAKRPTYPISCKQCTVTYCSRPCFNRSFSKHQTECMREAKIVWEDTNTLDNRTITQELFQQGYMFIALTEARKNDAPGAYLEVEIEDYLESGLLTKDDVSICSGELKRSGETKDRICMSIKLLLNQDPITEYFVTFNR